MKENVIAVKSLGNGKIAAKPVGFLGEEFSSYIAATKAAGAVYDSNMRAQIAPFSAAENMIMYLKKSGFALDIDGSLREAVVENRDKAKDLRKFAEDRVKEVESRLPGIRIKPYQVEGITWLAGRNKALLCDHMGLGKTAQSLLSLPDDSPLLIICPAVAKGVWQEEIAKWRPDITPIVLKGRKSFRVPQRREAVIVNFDILPPAKEEAKPGLCINEICREIIPGTSLIVDECHQSKSPKSFRTKRLRIVSRSIEREGGKILFLTGTPLLNRPPELWCILQNAGMVQETFGNWPRMVQLFSGVPGLWGGYEWGVPNEEVANILSRVMLRRRRTDVMKDLPKAAIHFAPVDITDKEALRLADEALSAIKNKHGDIEKAIEEVIKSGDIGFEEMSRARAALASAKIPAMLEIIQEYEEEEDPIVVFSYHRAPIDALSGREGWEVITGDTPAEQRTRIQADFQAGKLKGVAGTIQSSGVALTLTRACQTLFVDLAWVPGINEQAMYRVDRIGQTRPVSHKILRANHALENRVYSLLEQKMVIINETIEKAADLQIANGITNSEDRLIDLIGDKPKTLKMPTLVTYEEEYLPLSVFDSIVPERKPTRSATMPLEAWAASACLRLAEMDYDRATERNGVGFNKVDSSVGKSLADNLTKQDMRLTDKQWALLVRLVSKYHSQVGKPPKE